MVNRTGVVKKQEYYYSYGDNRGGAQNALTTKRFTGQYHEAGIGLYDYNARWYDPKLARFVSADTIVPDPGSSQSLNRYAYTLGNPLRFIDPTGHFSIDELLHHFGVDTFDEMMALFDEGGEYAGLRGWYDVLRVAQDGDSITAMHPSGISINGTFTRNDSGQILINMGSEQVVLESAFAQFGGYWEGGADIEGWWGLDYGMYHLRGGSNLSTLANSGSRLANDKPCATWDCAAIGYDVAATSGNLLTTAGLAGELPSGGLTTAGIIAGITINQTATAAALAHTIHGGSTGRSSSRDVAVTSATVILNPFPVVGLFSGLGQLVYDILDPFIPGG